MTPRPTSRRADAAARREVSPGPARANRPSTIKKRKAKGAALLEVVLALTLFVMSAAVVGSCLRGALGTANDLRAQGEALNLAETVLTELNAGVLALDAVPATPFDEDDPSRTYEIAVEPIADDPSLKRVTVTVRLTDALRPTSCRLTQWMLDAGPATAGEFVP